MSHQLEPTPSLKPVPKVTAAGVAGAVATALIGVLTLFGVDLSESLAAALGWLITFAAGYLKRG